MKFTDGYWMTRPEFRMHYAAEIYRVRRVQDELHVLAACKHVANRGDILNEATLEATFSAPIADVIRVEVVHFKGAKDPCVHYAAYTDETRPEIVEGIDYGRLIMDDEDVDCVHQTLPEAKLYLTHFDNVAHASITRSQMRGALVRRGVDNYVIPEDGETVIY